MRTATTAAKMGPNRPGRPQRDRRPPPGQVRPARTRLGASRGTQPPQSRPQKATPAMRAFSRGRRGDSRTTPGAEAAALRATRTPRMLLLAPAPSSAPEMRARRPLTGVAGPLPALSGAPWPADPARAEGTSGRVVVATPVEATRPGPGESCAARARGAGGRAAGIDAAARYSCGDCGCGCERAQKRIPDGRRLWRAVLRPAAVSSTSAASAER